MKDTFYFTHDYNARTDEKIKRLIRKHGMTGYGIFWAIIEDLYNNANALQTDCDGIAFELRTDSETIKSILHDFDLFIFEGDMFGSLSVQKRLDDRNERSKVASANARKRWDNMQTHSDSNATALPLQSEGNAIKERKRKEKKEIKEKENIPAREDFISYGIGLTSKDYEFTLGAKYDAWVQAGWKDGNGKKVDNWKTKLQNTIPFLKPFNPKTTTDPMHDDLTQMDYSKPF